MPCDADDFARLGDVEMAVAGDDSAALFPGYDPQDRIKVFFELGIIATVQVSRYYCPF